MKKFQPSLSKAEYMAVALIRANDAVHESLLNLHAVNEEIIASRTAVQNAERELQAATQKLEAAKKRLEVANSKSAPAADRRWEAAKAYSQASGKLINARQEEFHSQVVYKNKHN